MLHYDGTQWLPVNEGGWPSALTGVWGTSAGGHLSALLGTSGGVEELEGEGGWADQSSQVRAACPWSGPMELRSLLIAGQARVASGRDGRRGNPVVQLIGQPDR